MPFYCLLLRRVAAPRKGAVPKSMASDVEIREGRKGREEGGKNNFLALLGALTMRKQQCD